jgi:hypothetical protein
MLYKRSNEPVEEWVFKGVVQILCKVLLTIFEPRIDYQKPSTFPLLP